MIRGFWFISKIKNSNSLSIVKTYDLTLTFVFVSHNRLTKKKFIYYKKKKKKTNILTLCAESWRKNSQKHYDWQKGLHFLYLSKIKSQIYFDEDNVRLNVTSYCKLPLHSLAQKATYQYKIILKTIAIRLNCNEHTKIFYYAAITTHLDHSTTNAADDWMKLCRTCKGDRRSYSSRFCVPRTLWNIFLTSNTAQTCFWPGYTFLIVFDYLDLHTMLGIKNKNMVILKNQNEIWWKCL